MAILPSNNKPKSNSVITLLIVLLLVFGISMAAVMYMPGILQGYLAFDTSQIQLPQPLSLPSAGQVNNFVNNNQFNSLQMPAGVPVTIPGGAMGRTNPFAPF